MDELRKKVEVNDRRSSAATDDASATAPLAEEAPSDANAMTAQDALAHESMWQQQAEEYLELAKRREAELRNALRRGEDDRAHAVGNAIEALIADLFPALDALAQAADLGSSGAGLQSSQGGPEGPPHSAAATNSKLLDGVQLTLRLLQKGLGKHGIEMVGVAGEPFDGHLHQALSVEDGDVEHETVAEVFAEGYRIGERVLKPALVKVLKPQ
ncbi:MAG: nucleotide exchange factor GrpE [bacterium]|nr:nucleotide exchange factor GrpE [bacterium]